MPQRPLVIANWKMNPRTSKEAISLARNIATGAARTRKNADIVIAPPYPFLRDVRDVIGTLKLCAQDVSFEKSGPATGEVSAAQVRSIGVTHVIVGHSYRRAYLGETDEMTNQKLHRTLECGLTAILCVGEREREGADIPPIVGIQIKKALSGITKRQLKNVIIAYEPVWAISTNPDARPDTPEGAFRSGIYIRKVLTDLFGSSGAAAVRILYGGSVDATNVRAFCTEGNMHGALVGGASLSADTFLNIIKNI